MRAGKRGSHSLAGRGCAPGLHEEYVVYQSACTPMLHRLARKCGFWVRVVDIGSLGQPLECNSSDPWQEKDSICATRFND